MDKVGRQADADFMKEQAAGILKKSGIDTKVDPMAAPIPGPAAGANFEQKSLKDMLREKREATEKIVEEKKQSMPAEAAQQETPE